MLDRRAGGLSKGRKRAAQGSLKDITCRLTTVFKIVCPWPAPLLRPYKSATPLACGLQLRRELGT
jgi:hypothetical protein